MRHVTEMRAPARPSSSWIIHELLRREFGWLWMIDRSMTTLRRLQRPRPPLCVTRASERERKKSFRGWYNLEETTDNSCCGLYSWKQDAKTIRKCDKFRAAQKKTTTLFSRMSRIVTTFLTGHSLSWPRKPGLAYLQGTIIEKNEREPRPSALNIAGMFMCS